MGVGSSIVVFAVGAILRFAVSVSSSHFNVATIGVILMIVGAVGFVLSLVFWSSWGGFGGYRRERTIVDGTACGARNARTSSSGPEALTKRQTTTNNDQLRRTSGFGVRFGPRHPGVRHHLVLHAHWLATRFAYKA